MINRSFNTKTQKYYQFLLFFFCLFHYGMIVGQEQLTNLPTVYINTENNTSISSKEDYVDASVIVKSADLSEELTKTAKIRGRGNSTWGMPKKPYRLKFDEKTQFLNLNAEEKDWVLLANYADKTLIRNAVAFKISELVNLEFTPAARFVDVVLNGTKLGSYMVTDQIEVGKRRVPIEKQSPESTELPEISGGYLLEIDGFADGEPVWFQTKKGLKITVKYPKDDEINPEQLDYITNFTQKFEDRLFSENFTDPTTGYRAFVDTASLINWYIACELTGNSDSFWSTYIYKYKNIDKFYFGPLWDYDIAFNNDNRQGDAIEKLMRDHAYDPRAWIKRIWEDAWFKKAVYSRWMELINEKDIQTTLIDYINDLVTLIDSSQKQNFQIWNIIRERVHLEQFIFSSYKGGVDYLISYLNNRIDFLTKSFADNLPNEPFVAGNYYYTITNRQTGLAIQVENQSTKVNAKLELWASLENDTSQHWIFSPLGGDKFQVISRNSNLAMAGTGNIESLIQASPDETNERQQWHIIPLNRKHLYGIRNQKSNYSIDNTGGSSSNGTSAIEYYDEIFNNENQQWYIQPIEQIIPEETDLSLVDNADSLTLYFDPATSRFYVELAPGINKRTTIEIYSVEGKCLYRNDFSFVDKIEIPLLEHSIQSGIYIVKVISDTQSIVKKIIIKTP